MKTIAVFFGGQSAEHDVSIITALTSVIAPLELTKNYTVIPVYITKDGRWFVHEKLKDIATYQNGAIQDKLSRVKSTGVICGNGMKLLVPSGFGKRKEITVDIAFPAMHGTHGEDGELMGMFELAGIPYIGCGVAASAVAMDKVLAKKVASAEGILTPRGMYTDSALITKNPAATKTMCKGLHYPLFVKPAHLGSSIGVSRVKNEKELTNALEVAAHYDSTVIVEEAVPNLVEVTLPIMGPHTNPQPAVLEQPLTRSEDFFDFERKYMHGGKKGGKLGTKAGGKPSVKGSQGYSHIPANLPKDLFDVAVHTGLGVYRALGCDGIARVDMLVDTKAKKVYFNEVNPLPGSLYAHNWQQAGVSRVELVEKLITFALARHAEKATHTTTFTTNFLKQF